MYPAESLSSAPNKPSLLPFHHRCYQNAREDEEGATSRGGDSGCVPAFGDTRDVREIQGKTAEVEPNVVRPWNVWTNTYLENPHTLL